MTQTMTDTSRSSPDTIRFRANSVTGAQAIDVEFQRSTPAGAVAVSLAQMMGMPTDVPWGLRDDGSSVYLDERPIGQQIAPGADVSVAPKTHLG